MKCISSYRLNGSSIRQQLHYTYYTVKGLSRLCVSKATWNTPFADGSQDRNKTNFIKYTVLLVNIGTDENSQPNTFATNLYKKQWILCACDPLQYLAVAREVSLKIGWLTAGIIPTEFPSMCDLQIRAKFL